MYRYVCRHRWTGNYSIDAHQIKYLLNLCIIIVRRFNIAFDRNRVWKWLKNSQQKKWSRKTDSYIIYHSNVY